MSKSIEMNENIETKLRRAKRNAMRLDEIDTPTFKPINQESAADIGRTMLSRFNKEDLLPTVIPVV